jgi:hypothetical protein
LRLRQGAARGKEAKLNLAKSSQLNRAEVDKILRAGDWKKAAWLATERTPTSGKIAAARRFGKRTTRDENRLRGGAGAGGRHQNQN